MCDEDEATREVEMSTKTNLLWVGNTNANTIQTIVQRGKVQSDKRIEKKGEKYSH